ncbi:uncharacterized protein [Ptychodera flava]|uniref:uncharacterized protein isoform X2 n=1 Tax=Ptychodera flava TaxID=63121 RepID=UPI00396A6561
MIQTGILLKLVFFLSAFALTVRADGTLYYQCGAALIPRSQIISCDGDNIYVSSPNNMNLVFRAGRDGEFKLGHSDFFQLLHQQEEILQNFTLINERLQRLEDIALSAPPVWAEAGNHGNLGTYPAGSTISLYINARDPDDGSVTYSKISGSLPDGVTLDTNSGRLYGIAPSIDASFSFGIRALDQHGKYADAAFSLDIRGPALSNNTDLEQSTMADDGPTVWSHECFDDSYCMNEGNCSAISDGPYSSMNCDCPSAYGGDRCEIYCLDNPIGLSDRSKFNDSQFTGQSTYSNYRYYPWYGRLHNNNAWRGTGRGAYLQISFQDLYKVFAVATQGDGLYSSYGVRHFKLYYSSDGDQFTVYTEYFEEKTFINTGGNVVKKNTLAFPPIMRAIRFYVVSNVIRATLRVEVYGCKVNE